VPAVALRGRHAGGLRLFEEEWQPLTDNAPETMFSIVVNAAGLV
jgi:hypothetical protein